jgi:hypothetical protein
LSELAFAAPLDRTGLRRALRRQPERLEPGLRVLAEEVLADEARIDVVALDAGSRLVVVVLGDPGEDLALLGRALAQRSWVAARVRDWQQLAPSLGLDPELPVRAIAVCSAFGRETLSAAQSLGRLVELARAWSVRDGSHTSLLIEYVLPGPAAGAPSPLRPAGAGAVGPHPVPLPSAFRSGLSPEDLRLRPEEVREFDSPLGNEVSTSVTGGDGIRHR